MKKFVFVTLLGLGLPITSMAATFEYVNASGALQSVAADSPTQALALATNSDPHSGVMLESGAIPPTGATSSYEYVNVQGAVSMVEANDPSQALALATGIDPHSGVMALRNA